MVGVAHVAVDAAPPDPGVLQEGFEAVATLMELQVRRFEAGVLMRLLRPGPARLTVPLS
jgi:hypothetical protein